LLEEAAWKAKEDADVWAFLAMVRRQEEATHQATLREEERLLRLKHKAELQAAATEQWENEAAQLAHLRRPANPLDPHSAWERAQWSP
jgi:quinol monooxygenase YgiN